MIQTFRQEVDWGGRLFSLETGRMARQADGAVVARYGDTVVLAAVVGAENPLAGVDFLPLTVMYQEKYAAAGKIPGGFFKREARPTEKEVLTSRLIDRPIRPLFADGWRNETQVVATVLSHDLENDPDIVAMVGCSAALTLAGLPFAGPIAGARVGFENEEYVLNPRMVEPGEEESRALDLVVAGTRDAVMMVESEARELSEDQMLGAVMFGHRAMQPVIEIIEQLASERGVEPRPCETQDHGALRAKVHSLAADGVREALNHTVKQERRAAIAAVKETSKESLAEELEADPDGVSACFKEVEKELLRQRVLDTGVRVDGRDSVTVRPIDCAVRVLPRPHGSALFTRGETQALATTTLGTRDDSQVMDTLAANYRERFLLHYNFPPYSVGEARRMGPPGRREIGHGKLAWRALRAVLPTDEEFPYTIRLISEILESNGSSSMATVCACSLGMMDAGVPLKRPVAGIAMGLILEADRHAVLTDILGDEDHLGDMDFKVAGTDEGVTALQMDIKVAGVNEEIMRVALAQARDARMHVLGEMAKVLSESRAEFSEYAPKMESIEIPTDKIRDVIGSGGSVIRALVEETGAKIDVNDDGVVVVASPDGRKVADALERIKEITATAEPNTVYDGVVTTIKDFGVFVRFFGRKEGLVHVSELPGARGKHPSDVIGEGESIKVLYLGDDDRGRAKLTTNLDGKSSPAGPSGKRDGAANRRDGAASKRDGAEAGGEEQPVPGKAYEGPATGVKDFGVFVRFCGRKEGLVHVSEMAERHVNHPSDLVEEGHYVWVRYLGDDARGRAKLTMKGVDQDTGEVHASAATHERPSRPTSTLDVGEVYEGTVEILRRFGAIVDLGDGHSGLVHLSQMAERFVSEPGEIVSEGDKVFVQLTEIDDQGRNKLSMKTVDQNTGQPLSSWQPSQPSFDTFEDAPFGEQPYRRGRGKSRRRGD